MPNRRFKLYFAWNWVAENSAKLGVLEHRYPTLFEFRREIWPHYEHNAAQADQGVLGFMEHVVLSDFQHFRDVIRDATGNDVEVVHRYVDKLIPLTEELLDSTDTLIVVSLDHSCTSQLPTAAEIAAVNKFLSRTEACLIVSPHHDIGTIGSDVESQEVEHRHHSDQLVPAAQDIGGYARCLLEAIGVPVRNRFGLNPATTPEGSPESIIVAPLDDLGVLADVSTFNAHPHLPHLEIRPGAKGKVRVLAKQPINPLAAPHPFSRINTHFDALLWAPPDGERRGQTVICDATLWSAAFGGLASLETLWRNLARM
ncbi:hypothetical protein [Lacipirellula parvula]|uniref:Uncharacterized protein n=1 Tax=Lacipirellula parvula TaxID=2650471 RepID=A0A5K7XGK6_9BACT|nr:hypothetical protein [Lacipirellula parvula]BBO35588.1 hypothetical protein PLANPX_5200 [Lacipirellula parvula]